MWARVRDIAHVWQTQNMMQYLRGPCITSEILLDKAVHLENQEVGTI